jgi:hypothetical protein
MGISEKVIESLPKGNTRVNDLEKLARADRTDSAAQILVDDDDADHYVYNECYMRLDEDGDGVAELRKICIVGDTILHDEPTDHIPIAIWTPKVMPHEVVGISLADDVMDLQLLKSTLWRGSLDSLYLSIAPRMFVQGDVNMDDVLTVKPGGAIRGEAGSTLTPIVVPFVGADAFNMLEYTDQEKDARVGFSSLGPGMDPDSINKTATFVREMTNQTNARAKMIARNAAEFGFKPLFKGILYLLAKHQTQALMVRLNNKFVPVDPETWNKEYDMSCNVGLGVGNKEQQLMHLQMISAQIQAIAGSPFAPVLLTPEKIYNLFEKGANLCGFRDAEQFMNKPIGPDGKPLPAPPPPEPESVQVAKLKAQTDGQSQQMKMQADMQALQAKTQADMQAKNVDVQVEQQKMQMDAQREAAQAQADMAVERQKAELNAQLERESLVMKYQFEREKLALELQAKREEKLMEIQAQERIAHLNAQVTAHSAEVTAKSKADSEANKPKEKPQPKQPDLTGPLQEAIKALGAAAGNKKIIRGPDGKATGTAPA